MVGASAKRVAVLLRNLRRPENNTHCMSYSHQPIEPSPLSIKKAAEVLRKKREGIFIATYEIPTILSGTQRDLRIYRTSENLQNRSSALYVAVLHTLAHILLFSNGKRSQIWEGTGQARGF